MKIINPNFVPVVDDNAPHVKHREAVLSALRAAPEQEAFSFDDIRAALGMNKKQLPDGSIQQICQDAGIRLV